MFLIKNSFIRYLIMLLPVLVISCASAPKVTRTEAGEQIDLSGEWNDTDSQMVSAEMIKDALSRAWLEEFVRTKNNKPRIIVGSVLNKSHEHINTETFVKDLQRELINSGRVNFVASKAEREEIREERKDQQTGYTDGSTIKSFGKELGADFMLKGTINTILDEIKGKRVVYYQVDLELIDIETNNKAWLGQKKIKKLVKRPGSKL